MDGQERLRRQRERERQRRVLETASQRKARLATAEGRATLIQQITDCQQQRMALETTDQIAVRLQQLIVNQQQ